MKNLIIKTLTSLFFVLFLFSCDSMPVGVTESSSWRITDKGGTKGTIKLAGVTADRSGSRDSLEREVAVLAPLYFWTEGFRTVGSDYVADYIAEINLREREFSVGWSTRRSLVVEVRIWACIDGDILPDELSGKLPSAAGRVVFTGNKSFSSSKTTGKMLSGVISQTLRQLPRKKALTALPQQ
jgi:hypothetical protein